ncbi:chromosome partitioning protein ParA [Flavobacteriaceae bacterium AU392]|nr:chromosome partitioning protein ParA [Flavobacteriaceae bacterium]RKM85462.1 chromosome partitioning protein ParA [Flavobacteriaceae bacterium AU392]
MEDKAANSNRSLKVILGIAIALLIGTGVYSYTLYSSGLETEKQLTEEKQLVLNSLNEKAEQLDVAIGESQVANEKLIEAKERIESLAASLEASEGTVRNLRNYRRKFLALEKEMDALLAENDALKLENSLLATSLDSTQTELNERSIFNDSLLAQNSELATIVDDASILSAASLKGFGVIVRTSGKLIPTERARRADKVRVCYTIAKNTLVGSGDKEFFVQVLDPNDNVLGLNEQIEFEGQIVNYSLISKFNYEGNNLDICEFVEPDGKSKFEKGRYVVNVYDEDRLVTSSEFELK